MKICLVHDWLLTFSGAEKVLQQIYELYPGPIHTLFCDPLFSHFGKKEVITSFLQKCPKIFSNHTLYSPLFPLAIEQFDLTQYDLIISSSHCVAKGVIISPEQTHICYCHSPMRYIWDLYPTYLKESWGIKKLLIRYFFHKWRLWDVTSSNRVDHFIANSNFVAKRIEKAYRRKAKVIYPPVDTSSFSFYPKKEDYYVAASRLVPYKGIRQIVLAFSKLKDKRLVVIGDGPEMSDIKNIAGKNVEILGAVGTEKLIDTLQRAKAFIFNAIEDFGILPVEAQSTGTSVIALNKGGAKETVVDGKTGLFFQESNPQSIVEAIARFEKMEFDPHIISEHAKTFSTENFQKSFSQFVKEKMEQA